MKRVVIVATGLAFCLAAAACRPSLPSAYSCQQNSQCVRGGVPGVCEMSAQACSFPDATCAGGRRYGDLGPPPFAGNCVDQSSAFDLGAGDLAMAPSDGGAPKLISRVGASSLPLADHATTLALPAVAGAQAGDFAFAIVYASSANATVTAPSGWTLQADKSNTSGISYRAAFFYRTFGVGEPASYSFTLAAAADSAALMVAYRNVASSAVDVFSANAILANPLDATALVTRDVDEELVAMFVDATRGASSNLTAPAGMQLAGSTAPLFAFDQLQALAGGTGDKTPGNQIGGVSIGAYDFAALTPAR